MLLFQAKKAGRYDQGILDVGLTAEDHVELTRTHTFLRKHATGKAKIELHVLTVERGMSWEAAVEKWEMMTEKDEGFYLSHQVLRNFLLFLSWALDSKEMNFLFQNRNNKKTAILAMQTESKTRKNAETSKKEKLFIVYRPNTGQAVKLETLAELKKKYKFVPQDQAETHWKQQFEFSAKRCSHAYWWVIFWEHSN